MTKIIYDNKPLTIKRAKQLCRAKYGKLPRVGYEMKIVTDTIQLQGLYTQFPFAYNFVERGIWLQNNAGRYKLLEHVSSNPVK